MNLEKKFHLENVKQWKKIKSKTIKSAPSFQDKKEKSFKASRCIPRQFQPCQILLLQQMLQVGDHCLQLSLRAKFFPCALKNAAFLFLGLQGRVMQHPGAAGSRTYSTIKASNKFSWKLETHQQHELHENTLTYKVFY